MTRARDSQRSAVYEWENSLDEWPGRTLSLKQCEALLEFVWKEYYPYHWVPEIKDGRGRRRASGGRHQINLPRWSRTQALVLHEITHALMDVKAYQKMYAWHGPEFARAYLDILDRYMGIDKVKARRLGIHQSPRRVRFSKVNPLPKPSGNKKLKRIKKLLDSLEDN